MEDSTVITILTDSRGRATIKEPARLALAIDGLVSRVDLKLRVLCILKNGRVRYRNDFTWFDTTVYVDTQGRFSIPIEIRDNLDIDEYCTIIETNVFVRERKPP